MKFADCLFVQCSSLNKTVDTVEATGGSSTAKPPTGSPITPSRPTASTTPAAVYCYDCSSNCPLPFHDYGYNVRRTLSSNRWCLVREEDLI